MTAFRNARLGKIFGETSYDQIRQLILISVKMLSISKGIKVKNVVE